ncbi:uncharacterized protein MONBRDRAFT_29696 [Monosiga brevicollis MX1]|uniref:Cyclin-like domain-containing protein n=1 Tax=Monosiga brevicollis TaxID=81824 RepID=A9VBV3_MONBE|nr:uncharacterized protein MONBRDRAFT_29696 [Monosiga brevicollis MX1]EDQ84998.1 predicted protein [Monosiga brevicollis MX1]|eukprot:XP_001750168.1 hypothetical protein [Monosiga brevicollis MX1]
MDIVALLSLAKLSHLISLSALSLSLSLALWLTPNETAARWSGGRSNSRPPVANSAAARTNGMPSQAASIPEESLEHISDRQDHGEHEVQILHNLMPLSAASPSLPRSSKPRRRMSVHEDEEVAGTMNLANSQKFNSTSTIFVDSTVSSPNLEETLRCVALALQYILQDGHRQEAPKLFSERFDEKRFPLSEAQVRRDYATRIPSEDRIYQFLAKLFTTASLTAECGIITLVYINRVITYTGLALHASNWKRVALGAVLIASKCWDDQAVWNVDFCSFLPRISIEDMNELERTYLEMLDFNIGVESSVYAKYYFELRDLAERFDKAFPLDPLDKATASRLDAMSTRRDIVKAHALRAARSLDHDTFKARAILS